MKLSLPRAVNRILAVCWLVGSIAWTGACAQQWGTSAPMDSNAASSPFGTAQSLSGDACLSSGLVGATAGSHYSTMHSVGNLH